MKKITVIRSTLGLAISVIASSGYAQSNTLESIVVTADRQETRLGELATSIFAVDGQSLSTVNSIHINEALARVPGTWVSRGNGQEHLTAIRSPVLTGAGSCGAFQMSQDGIPLRAAGFCNVNQLFEANTEQAGSVEVIRGPGSVLYGANALHGAINVISQGVSQEFAGDVGVDFGPHSYQRIKTTISDTDGRHGYRVSFNGASDDGYKDDSGFDQQKLSMTHQYAGETFQLTTVFDATNLNQETAGFVQGPDAYKDSNLKRANLNPEAFRDASSYRLHTKIEWQGEVGVWTVTPYFRKTEMDFLQHFLPGTPLEQNGQESYGVQAMFAHQGNDKLEWMAGVDLEITDGYLSQFQAGIPDTGSAFLIATLPVGQHYDFEVDAQLISPFAQLRYQLNDNNRLNLGLRFESLDYDYNNLTLTGRTRDDGTACGFGGCRYSRPADRSDGFSNASTQLGWVHDFESTQQVFANISQAFRAPQANEMYRLQNDQIIADLDSEEATGFEMGYRTSTDRYSYSVAAYFMDKENVIFQDSDRNNVSDGETRHKGVEFNGSLMLSSDLSVDMVASYARHTYEANVSPRGVTSVIDGNDIDTSPKLTGSARLNWHITSGQNLELEWVHMGSYYTDEVNLNEYDGHDLVNLRYTADFEGWYFGARVTNLLSTDYAERADFGFGNERYFIGEPASLYLTVGASF